MISRCPQKLMCTVTGSHNPLEFELIWLTKSVCKNMQFPLIDLLLLRHPSSHQCNLKAQVPHIISHCREVRAPARTALDAHWDDWHVWGKREFHIQPAPLWLSVRVQQFMSSGEGLQYICVYLYMCTHPCIYIFIYLYKHYICIHTIYVIYNICIMHINSNKCICVIFKIEQLYLEVINTENWLYCWSVDLMIFF